jgi:hypothetical protein
VAQDDRCFLDAVHGSAGSIRGFVALVTEYASIRGRPRGDTQGHARRNQDP